MTSLPANQKLVTTQEYLEKMLVEDKKKKKREVDELDERSITDIWVEDLIAIEAALNERDLEKGSAEEPEFSEAKGSL